MRRVKYRGSAEQVKFVKSLSPFPAFVGGFGSGKTDALMVRAIRLKLRYPALNVAYYLPTYDLVDQIGFPRFEEKLDALRIRYRLNVQKKTITVFHKGGKGKIIFRTLDKPERIIGYQVADSFVDELDTLKTAKARNCWEKIIARNRQKKPDGEINTVAVGTTPEGFRFTYEQWGKKTSPSYELIQAPTASNARNLPKDYIDRLRETYPPQLLDAYVEGKFVNLTSGVVYTSFDRTLNNTDAVAEPGEALHIGMDFNVYNMSAVVHVIRGTVFAVDELTGIRDTPAMIDAIKEKYPGFSVTVYPDASGKSARTTNASVSDLSLLKDAGFTVKAPAANPPVKDRIVSFNALLCNGEGLRRYFVNTERCPELTADLEQLAYDKGEPDKSSGKDHRPDAASYFVHYLFPVRGKPTIRIR